MKHSKRTRTVCCLAVVAAIAFAAVGCEQPAPPPGDEQPASPEKAPGPKAGEVEATDASADDAAADEALTIDIDIAGGPRKIVMEAEAGEVVEPMQTFPDEAASGGTYVMTPEPPDNDHQTLGGETRLIAQIPKAGTYNIWLRVYWNHSCDNSLDAAIAGGEKIQVTSNTYKEWLWLQVARKPFELQAGPVPIVVSSREDESKLDQVLIVEAQDDARQDYVPTGIEKTD